MKTKYLISYFLPAAALIAVTGASAQSIERRATITGGGGPDRGKCTVEVVVDGAAEIEVRGDIASMKDLGGQPPQWRRFECTSPMPPNPGDFRFQGVDGRGQQQLVSGPRNGGGAVVRINDPEGGAGTYVFDLIWNRPGGPVTGNYPPPPPPDRGPGYDRDGDAYHRERDEYFRGGDWQSRLFQRVKDDLYHVQRESFADNGDRYRFAAAMRQLDDLQAKLSAGQRYLDRDLDEVVATMREVVQDNRLQPRDRDMLTDDLDRIRDFRDHRRDPRGQ